MNGKMKALGTKRSVIREIFEYGNCRRRQIGAQNVFDFSLGNPSVPTPKIVTETMQRLLTESDPVALHGYTSAPGDPAVRAAVAQNIQKRFDVPAKAENIYMTCGAAASLSIVFRALLEAGDEVIVPAPFFPEYTVFVENAGGKLKVVPGKKDTFAPDIEAIGKAITTKTRAILLNFPNNPTGAVISREDCEKLCTLLRQKQTAQTAPIYIISDEPYRELSYGKEVPYFPAFYDHTIVCYSFSKSLSLPGERIGYIFVNPAAEQAEELFAAVCGAGRALGYVCAPSLLQKTVAECLDARPDLAVYDRNRQLLYNSLTEMEYQAIEPDGAFYLFVKSPEPDAKAFCERAKKYELLLVPGDDFGGPGYVRISYCVGYEQIQNSLPAFKKLLEEYR